MAKAEVNDRAERRRPGMTEGEERSDWEPAVEVSGTHAGDAPRILMASGSTGGHIFPALAVAQAICARYQDDGLADKGPRIEFLGTARGIESRVIPRAGFPLRTVSAAGLKGIGGARWLENLMVLPKSALESALVLRDFRPDAVVGMGGYVAGPAMLEAALRGIPTLLIEPNAVPGFTNRVLAPMVRAAAVSFEETERFFGRKARLTGTPVRKGFFDVPAKEHKAPFTLLIVGGSQGSKALNDSVPACLKFFAGKLKDIRVNHQAGERDGARVKAAYQAVGVSAEVCGFIDDMPGALARADLVVSRAGATALAELAAAGKASLLVPFPAAADYHQLANARAFERAGAGRVLEQAELTPERLSREVLDLLGDLAGLKRMEDAARRLARPGAAESIADLVLGMVNT